MASLNKVLLIGNITKDLELKQTPTGVPVLRFDIAINRRSAKDKPQTADFASIVAWRQAAEFISRYFKKGKPIFICGSLQSRDYTDSKGNKRYVTEIVADEVGFVESKQSDETRGVSDAATYVPDAYKEDFSTAPFVPSAEDDLPF